MRIGQALPNSKIPKLLPVFSLLLLILVTITSCLIYSPNRIGELEDYQEKIIRGYNNYTADISSFIEEIDITESEIEDNARLDKLNPHLAKLEELYHKITGSPIHPGDGSSFDVDVLFSLKIITTRARKRVHEMKEKERKVDPELLKTFEDRCLSLEGLTGEISPVEGEDLQYYIGSIEDYKSKVETSYNELIIRLDDFLSNVKSLRRAVDSASAEDMVKELTEGKPLVLKNSISSFRKLCEAENEEGISYYSIGDIKKTSAELLWSLLEKTKARNDEIMGEEHSSTEELNNRIGRLEEDVSAAKAQRKALKEDIVSLKQNIESLDQRKWKDIHVAAKGLLPWILSAFGFGFLIVIPWCRKFSEQQEYLRTFVAEPGRITPIRIMMFVLFAAVAFVIIYFASAGYFGILF